VTIDEEFLIAGLDSTAVPSDGEEFPHIASTEQLKAALSQLYASFKKYSNYELEEKSTNHHNCRKAALLSQLLIKSKLLQVLGV
jgi:hypothetical protein